MQVKEIELSLDIIESHFKMDEDLLNIYHIEAGNGYKQCALRTFEDLKNTTFPTFKFYGVYEDEKMVGFFGTEEYIYVNTIFVNPSYRKSEYMKAFYKCLTSIVGDNYITALYKKNTRAIQFYIKNNGKVITDLEDYVVIQIGE